jgi:hypothetical protein
MRELSTHELFDIDGGKLETVSDYLLLGAGIALCFVAPQVAVPATIFLAVW